MATRTFSASKDNTSRLNTNSGGKRGAGKDNHLPCGKADQFKFWSYIQFNLNWSNVSILNSAYLELETTEQHFVNGAGSRAKAKVHRVTKSWAAGDAPEGEENWQGDDYIRPSVDTGKSWKSDDIPQVPGTKVRIDIKGLLMRWAPSKVKAGAGSSWRGQGKRNFGLRLMATDMNNGAYKFEVASQDNSDSTKRPKIVIDYEPKETKPTHQRLRPTGGQVSQYPDFEVQFFDDKNKDYPTRVNIVVRKKDKAWNLADKYWRVPPEQRESKVVIVPALDVLPAGKRFYQAPDYQWKARVKDQEGKWSDLDSGWMTFSINNTVPLVSVVEPVAPMSFVTLDNVYLRAGWTDPQNDLIDGIQIQVRPEPEGDPAWDGVTSPLWESGVLIPTSDEMESSETRRLYGGAELDPGNYTWRVRVRDVRGGWSLWDYGSFDLSVGYQPDPGETPDLTGYAKQSAPWRIVLRKHVNAGADNRKPGEVAAIIEDAANVGVAVRANDGGELFFTLPTDHPMVGECEPFQRHYAVEFYRGGKWEAVFEGLLTDFDANDTDVIVYGTDYLGLLSLSIDNRFNPASNPNRPVEKGGAKYVNRTIKYVIKDQLNNAKSENNSHVGFIGVDDDEMDNISEKVTIFSAYKERLSFIVGLIQSAKQGTGRTTRLWPVRFGDRTYKWRLKENIGRVRNNMKLSYGELVQGYRVMAMGDFATKAYGIGKITNEIRPRFKTKNVSGLSQETWGRTERAAIWDDLSDAADLQRRVNQLAQELGKVGKRVALGLRVTGIEPLDGYNLLDHVPLDIKHGVVDTSKYGSGFWTIHAVEWRMYPDGHQDTTLVVLPREDDVPPDPDLIDSNPISAGDEWQTGYGPPDQYETPGEYYVDMGTAPPPIPEFEEPVVASSTTPTPVEEWTWYRRDQFHPDPDTGEPAPWVVWDNFNTPPGYPGDGGTPPPDVTGLVVTPDYREHADGTSEPIFAISWDAITGVPDLIGFEVQWDAQDYEEDGTTLKPPDWVSYQTWKFGRDANIGALSPIIGGSAYGVRIRSYDMEGLVSNWTEVIDTLALPDSSAPNIPENVSAVGGYQLIGVTWAGSSAPDLGFYQVRWRAVAEVAQNATGEWNTPNRAKATRFIIDGLADVTEYEIQVRAIDRSGNVRVSGDPDDPLNPEVIANYANDSEAGWSPSVTATTTLIVPESVAFDDLVANFISTGIISASQILGGDLRLGAPGVEGTIRIYDSQGRPIGAWGDFGWIVADPQNPSHAIWASPSGEMKFTAQYNWDGTETSHPDADGLIIVDAGIEQGIGTTLWTTAIGPFGINAEAITFGSQFGGNNRVLNAGFELQDWDTQVLVTAEYTDATDWDGTDDPALRVNLDTTGSELRLLSH